MSRHYCTICGSKRNEDFMIRNWETGGKWSCKKHFSSVDKSGHLEKKRDPIFLELFSGSGEISKVAEDMGFVTITVDIEKKFKPDICIDIENLRRNQLPGTVDVMWISIPCTVYSILNLENHWKKICIGHRRYFYIPESERAVQALRILDCVISLIKKVDPKYLFIENPRGALRHFPHLKLLRRNELSYADYGFDYYKPTDIFHNCQAWRCKKIRTAKGRKFKGSVAELKNNYERSKVPPELIKEILNSCAVH